MTTMTNPDPKMSKKDLVLLSLLVFIPISMVAQWLHLNPVLVF